MYCVCGVNTIFCWRFLRTENLRERAFHLMAEAYSSITIAEAAIYMGFSPEQTVEGELCLWCWDALLWCIRLLI